MHPATFAPYHPACPRFFFQGTCSQWYFAPPNSLDYRGTTMKAYRNATGPNFGSLALGALVLAIIQELRKVTKQRNALSIVAHIILCLFQHIIEVINKFATTFVAVAGMSYIQACKETFSLFKRNFL